MNLVFHYQNILHNNKDGIFLHEAFSTRNNVLYSVNPLPVEVGGASEAEIEETLRAMESDSSTYKPIAYSKLKLEMERWVDENEIEQDFVEPLYEDEEDLSEDYLDESGEVIDLCAYIERNR